MVTRTRFELVRLAAPPPQSGASTNFATWPFTLLGTANILSLQVQQHLLLLFQPIQGGCA